MNERIVTLLRSSTGDNGTYGLFSTPGFQCYSAELPWRDNRRKVSCIPEGDYPVRIVQSPRFGRIYGLFNVPGRSSVLIHSGNFSGDISLGYASHVEGCILLGRQLGKLQRKDGKLQSAILVSLPTVRSFMEFMGGEPFTLSVRSTYNQPSEQGVTQP